MRTNQGSTIKLADYQQPPFWIETVALTFKLHPTKTRVISKIVFRKNDTRPDGPHALRLDGRGLALISAAIDGKTLGEDEYLTDEEGLSVPADLVPQDGFVWDAEVEINPEGNTALEGLYMSGGMYCTQCEAQGFRKITYYYDRPDVMAKFDVKIESDLPVLLSNGNDLGAGAWHDPWPKPAYLFALVAGELVAHSDSFITTSGRNVDLNIYVRKGDEDKCDYAMDALKRSMVWDEEVYGREYDLDLFNIVAVDDFNMGAMENKGLNIFNSKYVLASPETATDRDYELIEGIIAHEYFHNWTGNRITCRDWFQLCLKEGLTVFRDQQFSGDMRNHGVKRIDDVLQLRARQFREDAGPLAHPVRPEEYIEINNFYTATVYEKGAEVIGMLKLLVGDDGYRRALDLYFDRHDGQACTIEDWVAVFEDACGRDLSQFKLWYSQAGTPKVTASEEYSNGRYTLSLEQSSKPTPGQERKSPQVIPVNIGLLGKNGEELIEPAVLELTEAKQSWSFETSEKPTASILRGFSAPVTLEHTLSRNDRLHLLSHDSDSFNRWESGRILATDLLVELANGGEPDPVYVSTISTLATDNSLDPAYRALMLSMPSEDGLAQTIYERGGTPDPDAIHAARKSLSQAIADEMGENLNVLYAQMETPGPYSPDAASAGKRALRSIALALMAMREPDATSAKTQFAHADNMTEQFSALGILIKSGQGMDAVASFYDQWKSDKLVTDKWFAIQPSQAAPDAALETAIALSKHSDFNWKNPNRFRSLIGPFAMNQAGFHQSDGAGYAFVMDWLMKLDEVNPQTTARMCGLFETWKRYDTNRQTLMKAQMQRLADKPNISKDSQEIIGKILSA